VIHSNKKETTRFCGASNPHPFFSLNGNCGANRKVPKRTKNTEMKIKVEKSADKGRYTNTHTLEGEYERR
jgi:hypothetical protein